MFGRVEDEDAVRYGEFNMSAVAASRAQLVLRIARHSLVPGVILLISFCIERADSVSYKTTANQIACCSLASLYAFTGSDVAVTEAINCPSCGGQMEGLTSLIHGQLKVGLGPFTYGSPLAPNSTKQLH